ncbi:SNF2 domain-containing protein CLASSY 4 [Quercus suber]|uniref:Snf2 domain-containing protein classy 3 n=1 Tax=Quercus suber TaxID=58331 RepID=A0AAW0KQ88_QUESU
MDYSLPIASRTRQGRAQFYGDCIVEKKEKMKKGRKESNGVDLAGSSRPHRVDGVKGYERLGSESESFAVSDSSVEEINVDDCSEEGDELTDFVGNESLKLKNKGNSNKGFEGMANVDEIMLDDSEDEVVILGEGRDLVGEEREEDVICIDVDEEDDMSEKDVTENGELNSDWRRGNDEPVSLRKGKGETSSLNIDERKSSEDGDGCGDAVFDDSCDAVDLGASDSSLESSSCEEDKDYEDDQDYEVEKLETCASLEQLSSDSGGEEEEKGEDAEEFEVEKRGSHGRGRPKGVDVGLKRRKYGLEILVDVENDEDNCVARRTRSCFVSKLGKKKMKLGTLSHPLCVDEEEVESSSGHDDSNDGADDVGSGGVKAGSNDESEDYSSDDETGHGGKIKSVSASEKFKTNRGNIDACERNLHGKDKGKLKIPIKGNRIRLSKNCNVLTILADSILEKGDRLEELVSFRDESNPPVAEISLPLKFTFGIQESNPPEKSEEEKEMDKLWADMELALRSSEIGYVDAAEVEDEDSLLPEDEVDRATLCHQGYHQLILDEEVGLRCEFCPHVQLEIKYIVPDFSRNPFRKSDRRDSGAMNNSIIDELSSQDWCSDSLSNCDPQLRAEGTVWDIIPGIKNSLYPHQCEGFEFIWKNIAGGIHLQKLKHQTTCAGGSGCIISHAPGTGKTRLTIVFLQTYMKLHPTCRPVIVAPRSMLLTWEEEFQKWDFDIPFHNLNKNELSGKEKLRQDGHMNISVIRMVKLYSWKKDRSILGISYTLFEKLAGEVNKKGKVRTEQDNHFRKILLEVPGIVVLDEGHVARNPDSRILQVLSNIKTDKRIILSGTPFQNNFYELYNTLCLARPVFEDKEGKWLSLTSSITKVTDDRLKYEKLKKVRDMIQPFVHVHKGFILQEKLPGLRDSLVILQPSQLQKSLFEELRDHFVRSNFKFDHYESLISLHPSLLLQCVDDSFPSDKHKLEKSNLEAGVKAKFLIELIRLSEAVNEKVLVFSQFLEPLAFIKDQLKYHFNWNEGKEMLYMDGKHSMEQRQSSINVFNDPTSEARVLLASIKASREGINLVGASRVVLLDVVWNPSVERQAICRAYRLGQKKVVYIYHLIASGAREEAKYYRQTEKDLLSELVFCSSGRGCDQQKIARTVSDDKILEEMVQHDKLKYMFEKIAYQQKESKLIETYSWLEKEPVTTSPSRP